MSILNVRRYPDVILREVCEPVTDFAKYHQLISDMKETLQKSYGLGLAANQVGVPVRIIATRPITDPGKISIFINPGVVEGEGESSTEEACLSLPGYSTRIKRYSEITVFARDEEGNRIEFTEEGLAAVVLQHEIDHLDGRLFIDHLGPVGKEMFKTKWKKIQRDFKRQQKEQ